MTCINCKEEKVKAEYIGESSRSLYQRSSEHLAGARRKDPKNPIVSHSQAFHSNLKEDPTFSIELLRTFRTPLARLIAEAVMIEQSEADVVINSKSEWGSSRIPRLTLEVGQTVKQEDFRGKAQPARRLQSCTPIHQGAKGGKGHNNIPNIPNIATNIPPRCSPTAHRKEDKLSTTTNHQPIDNTNTNLPSIVTLVVNNSNNNNNNNNRYNNNKSKRTREGSVCVNTNLPTPKRPCYTNLRHPDRRGSPYSSNISQVSGIQHTLTRWLTKPSS